MGTKPISYHNIGSNYKKGWIDMKVFGYILEDDATHLEVHNYQVFLINHSIYLRYHNDD